MAVAADGTVTLRCITPQHNLTVDFFSLVGGSVRSAPSGIVCPGSACTSAFQPGTVVTLTAEPVFLFTHRWGGACTGTSPICTVTMDAAKSVTLNYM